MTPGIKLRSAVVSTVGSIWAMEIKIVSSSTTPCAWPFPITQTVRPRVKKRSRLSRAKSKSPITNHTPRACGKLSSHRPEQLRFNLRVILIWSIISNVVMTESTFSPGQLMVIISARVDSADQKVLLFFISTFFKLFLSCRTQKMTLENLKFIFDSNVIRPKKVKFLIFFLKNRIRWIPMGWLQAKCRHQWTDELFQSSLRHSK